MIEGMSHPTYNPRRQSRSLAVPLLAMAVLVLGIACVVLAVLLVRKPGPAAAEVRAHAPAGTEPASDPRDSWTHKELVEHLNKNGARVRIDSSISWDGRLNAVLCEDGAEKPNCMVVVLCKSRTDAAEFSGMRGERSLAWGRFVFWLDDSPLASRVKAALK